MLNYSLNLLQPEKKYDRCALHLLKPTKRVQGTKRSHQYKKNEKLRTATVFKNTHAAKQYNRTHVEVRKKDQKQLKDFVPC